MPAVRADLLRVKGQTKTTGARKTAMGVGMAGAETLVKRSRTGLGLFAKEEIPKGARIVQYTGPVISNEEVRRHRGKYLFRLSERATVDGGGRANRARYVNHACRPNAFAVISRGRIWFVAHRKIRATEEITIHYGREYFDDYIRPRGCRCGTCSARRSRVERKRA